MSLCRWSHSPFYIYKECGDDDNEIKVQFEGYFTSNKILNDPIRNVYLRARNSGYGILDSIELLVWLYPWALYNKGKLTGKTYHNILEFTRFVTYIRSYVKGDHETNFSWIVMKIEEFIWKIEKKLVKDPIHELPWEEKRNILNEWMDSKYGNK